MGSLDSLIRSHPEVLIVIPCFTDQNTGPAAAILGIIAVIFPATSLIGFSPLYAPLKISTLGQK